MEHDSREQSENKTNEQCSNMEHDASSLFQSVWFRYRTVLANQAHWQLMERKCRFVLHCGSVFWAIYLLSMVL